MKNKRKFVSETIILRIIYILSYRFLANVLSLHANVK